MGGPNKFQQHCWQHLVEQKPLHFSKFSSLRCKADTQPKEKKKKAPVFKIAGEFERNCT